MEKPFQLKSKADYAVLRGYIKDALVENRIATRARLLLLRAQGRSQTETAEILFLDRETVSHWETRYSDLGPEGVFDNPGRGRKPSFSP
jgi:transposase